VQALAKDIVIDAAVDIASNQAAIARTTAARAAISK
jgi:hypothetical protein